MKKKKTLHRFSLSESQLIRYGVYLGYDEQFNPISSDNFYCKNQEVQTYLREALEKANKWLPKEPIFRFYDTWFREYRSWIVSQPKVIDNICIGINRIRQRTLDYSKIYIKDLKLLD